MATYNKVILSGSTNGKQIIVSGSASGGAVTIHTAVSGELDMDEIWLWATNSQVAAVKLTLEWGGTSSPDDNIEVTIPGESGLFLVVPGLVLQNDLVVKAFAATENVIMIVGFVNRITA